MTDAKVRSNGTAYLVGVYRDPHSKEEANSLLGQLRLLVQTLGIAIAQLELVRSRRATQMKQPERLPFPHAAIVGYTNAGKSSLLRRLTGAEVLVADKLFSTLDPTTRRVDLGNGQPLLLTDTVGFVRNLPHRLIESFKATLEEAARADFLVRSEEHTSGTPVTPISRMPSSA